MLKNRYLRQVRLLGMESHSKLRELSVGIIGTGGLGSASAVLCAQLGVRKLILMDRDRIAETDFNRQQFFEKEVGGPKVEALKEKIALLNSDVQVDAVFGQFAEKTSSEMRHASVILDGTDNYASRILINRFSLENNIPWVFASALKFEGMLSTILPRESACLACWAKKPGNELQCEDAGIINTTVSAIASLQVQELVNIACFNKPLYVNALLRVDLRKGISDKMTAERNPECRECSKYP